MIWSDPSRILRAKLLAGFVARGTPWVAWYVRILRITFRNFLSSAVIFNRAYAHGLGTKCQCIRLQIKGLRTEQHRQTPGFQLGSRVGARTEAAAIVHQMPCDPPRISLWNPLARNKSDRQVPFSRSGRANSGPGSAVFTEQSGPNPTDLPFPCGQNPEGLGGFLEGAPKRGPYRVWGSGKPTSADPNIQIQWPTQIIVECIRSGDILAFRRHHDLRCTLTSFSIRHRSCSLPIEGPCIRLKRPRRKNFHRHAIPTIKPMSAP